MMRWKQAVAFTAIACFLVFLYFHDPERGGFPSCPFRFITGYLCPGCGSQRAVHDLMHGCIAEAFAHNALLVVGIPLLAFQWLAGRLLPMDRPPAAHNAVVYAWATAIIGWGVLRNVFA